MVAADDDEDDDDWVVRPAPLAKDVLVLNADDDEVWQPRCEKNDERLLLSATGVRPPTIIRLVLHRHRSTGQTCWHSTEYI